MKPDEIAEEKCSTQGANRVRQGIALEKETAAKLKKIAELQPLFASHY